MLTPVEMQNRPLKTGRGYKKNEMDEFLEEIFQNYEQVYKENLELKDKLAVLSDGLQYYKDLEKTLQKTLVVAEKAAEETRTVSIAKANAIEQKAQAQARYIIEDAKKQAEKIHNQTLTLLQQYENYRAQYKQLVSAQFDLMESEAFHLRLNNIADTPDFLKKEKKNIKLKMPSSNKTKIIEKELEISNEQTVNVHIESESEAQDEKKDNEPIHSNSDMEKEAATTQEINIPEIEIPEVNMPTIEIPDINPVITGDNEVHKDPIDPTDNISINEIVKKELKENLSAMKQSSLEAFAPETKEEPTATQKPLKQEVKTELKRPDKMKITRPERLRIHKTGIETHTSIDDTFEFF